MIVSKEEIFKIIDKYMSQDEEFYLELLKKIIKEPERYFGVFRLSKLKNKLIQNITQSREIRFGNILEDIVSKYLEKMGYENINKNLGKNEQNQVLKTDQFFKNNSNSNILYMVEMKVRDDHDSAKKWGEFKKFKSKISLIKKQNPNKLIKAIMWFVDENFDKNQKYYREEIQKLNIENVELYLFYGSEFFSILKNGNNSWNELIDSITDYKKNKIQNEIIDLNFGKNPEVLKALVKLGNKNWNKLISEDLIYKQLRQEIFSDGDNLSKAKKERESLQTTKKKEGKNGQFRNKK
ncbi:HpyAIV family type II restriction enzyme [Mycoplasma sp. 1654_15]|uniref:HpyAIV family type II restriction enzyme n=1 Tax=Mycoplasma sp. 1654_15 TaxID=2725994 RepID=UPI001449435A|nr:restriction endonuclease [Mycoplasma sp. 1654_15]QJB71039.1 restriction endonuclease [Mycoplasma sp. 1654_15]